MKQYKNPSDRRSHYKWKLDYCVLCRFGENNPEIDYRHLEHHHIDEVSKAKNEGRKVNNYATNLISLCGTCHKKIHNGEIELDRYYQSTSGLQFRWRNINEEWKFTKL